LWQRKGRDGLVTLSLTFRSGAFARTRPAAANRSNRLARPVRIADSSSTNAVSFSSARTMKRFPSSRCASTIQIVRPSRSTAETQPELHPPLLRLSAMISQYFIRVQVDHELPPVAPKFSGHVMGVYVNRSSRQRFRNKSSRAKSGAEKRSFVVTRLAKLATLAQTP
jgi:hypothetical protein